jgi:5'-nucleotidase
LEVKVRSLDLVDRRLPHEVSALKQFAAPTQRRALVLVILLAALTVNAQSAKSITVKIIAFNDFHGYLQSPGNFSANAQSPTVPSGGADALAAYVKSLASENPNHVVVAAGDLIGASPLVSALFHDEPTIEAMNRIGLDITSVGNHEFDKGSAELLRKQNGGCATSDQNTCEGSKVGTPTPFEGAKFQYLSANVIDSKTGKTLFPAYAIKTFGGVPIAFIGLTLEATPTIVTPSGVAGLEFTAEAATINNVAHDLEKKGVHSFVVLIHQGGQQTTAPTVDINACEGGLAGSPIADIVAHLDPAVGLVVSGHTHAAYICELPDAAGHKIPVTSAASFGRLVTDIDVTLDTTTKQITVVTAQNIVVDRTNSKSPPDPALKSLVDAYAAIAAPLANRKVGSITGEISNKLEASGESPLGDLVADAQLAATRESAGAQIAFMNRGGIRAPLNFTDGGAVTYGELFTVQPFSNTLVTMTLTGAQIKTLLEQQFKGCALDLPPGKAASQSDNRILQVSGGFTYSFNPASPACGNVDAASLQLDGKPVATDEKYRVTVNSFLADGGDGMYELTRGTDRVVGPNDVDALADYFAAHPQISPSPMGRIKLGATSAAH